MMPLRRNPPKHIALTKKRGGVIRFGIHPWLKPWFSAEAYKTTWQGLKGLLPPAPAK